MAIDLINPARVDFVTLKLFCAVARSGSITRGALLCHLALSAASRRIADLEAAAGVRLLQRGAQGVTLTPAGHVALQHALRLTQGLELFGQELGEVARRGNVRLWANMSSLVQFLPSALASFMTAHPEIRVDVEEQLSGDIVRALMEGLADVGVFAEGQPADGLRLLPFQVDELVILCAKDHPLAAGMTPLRFADCLAHEFVGLNRGSSLLEVISAAARDAGQPLRLRIQVRSFDAMAEMIAAGLGIGVLPRGACPRSLEGLVQRPLTDRWARRTLMVATRSGRELPAPAALLLAHLTS